MRFFYDDDSSTYSSYRRLRSDIRFYTAIIVAIYYLCRKYHDMLIPIIIGFTLLTVIILFLKHLWRQYSYRTSIRLVAQEFISGSNTIRNQNCIIKYVPDTSISVTDNTAIRQMRDIRTFTITKKEVKNINKCWNDICKIFMENTFFDTIYSYIQQIYGIDAKVVLIPVSKPKTPPTAKKIHPAQKTPKADIVNFDNVPTDFSNKMTDKNIAPAAGANQRTLDIIDSQEFYSMEDLMKQNEKKKEAKNSQQQEKTRLNVNKATAEEISKLPGINIVGAKKIVDFRNKERNFKSVEDFIEIAGVKEYFAIQIKDLITIENDNNNPSDDTGRIIDL